MDLSLYLAKVLGIYLVVKGVAGLSNLKYYARLVAEIARNEALILFIACFDLLVGLAIVIAHNVWVADWQVGITIVGWIAVLKGLFVLNPRAAGHWMKKFSDENTLMTCGIVAVSLGVFLVYVGFVA
jgi:hypothetical protein